jgi:hypothetical protein
MPTTDFLYTDQIEFDAEPQNRTGNSHPMRFSYIQNVLQMAPQNATARWREGVRLYLDENDPINGNELVFTNQKPYVIWLRCYSRRKKAIFNAGSHVYFHANSGLIVSNNASLNINGSKSNSTLFENEVVFESDRLQPEYTDVGQWGTIWLTDGSTNNTINHLTIKMPLSVY